jgi:hypothetical protein
MLDGTTVVVIIGFGAVAVAALVIGIRVFSVNEGIERSIGAGLALFGGSVGVLGGSIVAMRLDRWDLAGPLTRWWFLPSEGSLGALGSFLASPSMALLVAAVLCFFAPVTFEVDKGTRRRRRDGCEPRPQARSWSDSSAGAPESSPTLASSQRCSACWASRSASPPSRSSSTSSAGRPATPTGRGGAGVVRLLALRRRSSLPRSRQARSPKAARLPARARARARGRSGRPAPGHCAWSSQWPVRRRRGATRP